MTVMTIPHVFRNDQSRMLQNSEGICVGRVEAVLSWAVSTTEKSGKGATVCA